MLEHKHVDLDSESLHVVETGHGLAPTVLFLHGWPENWSIYKELLELAGKSVHALAIDLPGIGESVTHGVAQSSKRDIADLVHKLVLSMELKNLTLVGHDVGGQIVFAYLSRWADELDKAVIMDVVVPGIKPWEEVIRNPYIWHFGFHAIHDLPEALVTGKERQYFDYFYDAISAQPKNISEEARAEYERAYSSPTALTAGFNWYRAFAQDAKDNIETVNRINSIETPLLYLRGDHESGVIEKYVTGFKESGIKNVQSGIILDSGHFAPEEQPKATWEYITKFMNLPARSVN